MRRKAEGVNNKRIEVKSKILLFTFYFLLLTYLIILVSACAVSAVDSKNDMEMTLTGTIRLVGNVPFTHLVLTTDDGRDYLIKGRFEKELRRFQYQRVEIKGEKLPASGEFKYCIDVKEYKVL